MLDRAALTNLLKMTAAAGAMGLCVWTALRAAAPLLPAGKLGEIFCLGLCTGLGVTVYFLLTLVLQVEEAKLALSFIWKRG